MKIDDNKYKIESEPPIEIMHEQRAMTITLDRGETGMILLINGVNFDELLHVNTKYTLTEEDRRHEDFTKFFKQCYN